MIERARQAQRNWFGVGLRNGLIDDIIDISQQERTMDAVKQPINFIDNPHASTLFATDATGFWLNNGCLHITFEATRVDHSADPAPLNRVVVGRLVMPIAGAKGFVFGLYEFLKGQGIIADAPEDSPTQKH